MNMTTKTAITVSDIQATALIFDWNGRKVVLDAENLGTLAFWDKHGQDCHHVTHHANVDDYGKGWFVFYVEDCFAPPLAIIRADSFETAYEIFCDEFERWIRVDETDAADYPEDERNYNGNGTHIDTESVQGAEIRLVSVQVV
jgi:hypothetical protein